MSEEKKGETPNLLEQFIAEHKDFFEKHRRIAEEVEEEMEKIARNKAEHPELNDLDYQLELTNRFIEANPDVPHVTLDVDEDK